MNNFDQIINKTFNQLSEENINPAISQAVDTIESAVKKSGQVAGNTTSNTPLMKAFDKIKENPENPNLDETELAAFLLLAQNLNPDTKSSTPDGKTANATPSPSTPTSSPSTEVAPSGQPNAKLYNPLNTTTV